MKIRSKTRIAGFLMLAFGQEWWQILNQWVWNLRLELGQHLSPTTMRLTEFAPAQVIEPAQVIKPALFGPPQWARAAQMGGFAGSAFVPQPDGTVCCPTGQSLFPQERRPERDGSLRIVYAARMGSCRLCLLRDQCLGYGANTKRPRRVSAVLWPLSASPPLDPSTVQEPVPIPGETHALAPLHPLLWGDWERCQIRRRWIRLLHTQTVTLTTSSGQAREVIPTPSATV